MKHIKRTSDFGCWKCKKIPTILKRNFLTAHSCIFHFHSDLKTIAPFKPIPGLNSCEIKCNCAIPEKSETPFICQCNSGFSLAHSLLPYFQWSRPKAVKTLIVSISNPKKICITHVPMTSRYLLILYLSDFLTISKSCKLDVRSHKMRFVNTMSKALHLL